MIMTTFRHCDCFLMFLIFEACISRCDSDGACQTVLVRNAKYQSSRNGDYELMTTSLCENKVSYQQKGDGGNYIFFYTPNYWIIGSDFCVPNGGIVAADDANYPYDVTAMWQEAVGYPTTLVPSRHLSVVCESDGLSGLAIVCIVVGVIILSGIFGVVLYFFVRHFTSRKRRHVQNSIGQRRLQVLPQRALATVGPSQTNSAPPEYSPPAEWNLPYPPAWTSPAAAPDYYAIYHSNPPPPYTDAFSAADKSLVILVVPRQNEVHNGELQNSQPMTLGLNQTPGAGIMNRDNDVTAQTNL